MVQQTISKSKLARPSLQLPPLRTNKSQIALTPPTTRQTTVLPKPSPHTRAPTALTQTTTITIALVQIKKTNSYSKKSKTTGCTTPKKTMFSNI